MSNLTRKFARRAGVRRPADDLPPWPDEEPPLLHAEALTLFGEDGLRAPDPEAWLEWDEGERVLLIQAWHEGAGVELPVPEVHAALHVAVENQILLGEATPVAAAMDRLMRQGLDRHEAIHAVGCVLMATINEAAARADAAPDAGEDVNPAYFAAVEVLTADSWRADYGEEEED